MGSYLALEKFFQIRAEKQKHIVNAAFMVFGKQGYRKASIADIAKEAGTTKGMITYYFGSKKTLYLFLVETINSSLIQTVKERLAPNITDFFERMRIVADIQVTAIKEYPALISFVNSTYYEKDPEVAEDLKQITTVDNAELVRMLMDETSSSSSRFKPQFDSQMIRKFTHWAAIGFMEELCDNYCADKVDKMAAQFYVCLDTMRKAFYK